MLARVREAGLEERIHVDSAGTAAYHVGEPADPRAQETARRRGVRLASRGRQFLAEDFERFDYVLAMDRENHADLASLAASEGQLEKLHHLREFDPDRGERRGAALDVPDPYYGGEDGFERVFEICDASCRGLLAFLADEHRLR